MSDDYFKTMKTIDSDAFGFYQSNKYLFVLVRPDIFSTGYDLKVAEGYQANEIVLPVDDQRSKF